MKKFLFLTLIFCAVISTAANAQPQSQPQAKTQPQAQPQPPDPAVMLQQMKEKIRPEMVAKTGLTEAQCDKVIELNFEMRMAAAGLKDLPEADRTAKIQELKAAKEKKFTEFLTPEQIKAVKDFYENMGKKTP
jgi:hypothetical protein